MPHHPVRKLYSRYQRILLTYLSARGDNVCSCPAIRRPIRISVHCVLAAVDLSSLPFPTRYGSYLSLSLLHGSTSCAPHPSPMVGSPGLSDDEPACYVENSAEVGHQVLRVRSANRCSSRVHRPILRVLCLHVHRRGLYR